MPIEARIFTDRKIDGILRHMRTYQSPVIQMGRRRIRRSRRGRMRNCGGPFSFSWLERSELQVGWSVEKVVELFVL